LPAANSALGRREAAQAGAAEVLRADPNFSVSRWKQEKADFKDRAAIDRIASLLVEASLPE
jgi:hypothetical protein